MFGWFRKNERQRLREDYRKKLESARDLQRGGDIRGYAAAMAEAEEIARRIDEHEAIATSAASRTPSRSSDGRGG